MSWRLLWDLAMILLLWVNLALFSFDLTYFYLRPFYVRYAPLAAKIYDPVKGVAAHPLTMEVIHEADTLFDPHTDAQTGAVIAERLNLLSRRLIADNPFVQSGHGRKLVALDAAIADLLESEGRWSDGMLHTPLQRFELFWKIDDHNRAERRALYMHTIRPMLTLVFERYRQLDGEFADHFIWLDLPFLTIFFWEFMISWYLAIQRKVYIRWFLYPLYHWYDIIGLFPYGVFRALRLFRLVSIYMRLKKNMWTTIGDDWITRKVQRSYQILTEEIADIVAIRILSEIQDEIRSGASADLFLKAIEPRKAEIKALAVDLSIHFFQLPGIREDLRRLLRQSLAATAKRFSYLPLVPVALKEVVLAHFGDTFYDALIETIIDALDENRTQNMVTDALDFILTGVPQIDQTSVISTLSREITIDIIENMKAAVAVKKWAETPLSPILAPNNACAAPRTFFTRAQADDSEDPYSENHG